MSTPSIQTSDPVGAITDGLILVAKRECPTCVLVEPLLPRLAAGAAAFRLFSQDDPDYGAGIAGSVHDEHLEHSYRLDVEIVPTLIRVEGGKEVARTYGWDRAEWQRVSGIDRLGIDLPALRPGCGSMTLEPGIAERLAIRFGKARFHSRQVALGDAEDPLEACFDRGWTDGLPVVPPTPERVLRMLAGTTRSPDEILGSIPPDLAPCTVEKVAINAVMAGCKPEYMPIVLAAVEAALIDEFGMHGILCTTMFCGPVVIANGPVSRAIGMNSGTNALGQGNRANASIGRALQLVIRNVGGGRPGEIDRSALGTPGKYTFCFAEAEDSAWAPLSVERGFAPGVSTVTLFAGEGVQGIVDQKSRTPESLARTFAACMRVVDHPKLAMAGDALLIVSPEHARVFIDAGWSKARLLQELIDLLKLPADDMVMGAGGITEGLPPSMAGTTVSKFRPGGILIVRAGGTAGLFSAVVAGWAASGAVGSTPVTQEITA